MSCSTCHRKECCCRGKRGPRGHQGPPGPPGERALVQALIATAQAPKTIGSPVYQTLVSIALGTEFPSSKLVVGATFSASTSIPGSTAIFRLVVNGVAQPETAGISLYGGNVLGGGSLQALVDAPEGVTYVVELQAKALVGSVTIRPVTNEGEHADLLVQEIHT